MQVQTEALLDQAHSHFLYVAQIADASDLLVALAHPKLLCKSMKKN